MPESNNKMVVAIAVLLLAVVAGGIAVLVSRAPDEQGAPDSPLAGVFDRSDEGDGSDAADGAATGSTTPKIDTDATGEIAPPKKNAKTGASTTSAPGTKPPAADPAWQEYLDDTRAVVTTNRSDLTDVIATITAALGSGDRATLQKSIAPDEAGQAEYLTGLAEKYPTILESQPGGTVNIFSVGGTTVYFGYSIVTWTDAGIVSQHTIPIMLRFVNGEWALTALGDTAEIEFVQSVQL